MKDSEFIELLNLYLDHEISAADAVRLEAEVQGNPARRQLYQNYCRMQKACAIVGEKFVTEASPAPAGKVVAFAAPPRRPAAFAFGGLMAAAACVALVLISRNRPATEATPSAPAPLAVATVPAPARSQAASAPASSPARLVGAITLADHTKDAAVNPLFVVSEQTRPAQFAWMDTVQMRPIQGVSAENLKFETQPSLRPDTRPYSSGRPLNQGTEWNALRFQLGR